MGARFWTLHVLIFTFLCFLCSIAGHIQLQYHAVMHQPVYRGCSGHRVFKYLFPFTEWQIAGNQYSATSGRSAWRKFFISFVADPSAWT